MPSIGRMMICLPLTPLNTYPDAKVMLCDGHAARAHGNMLKQLKTKKSFTDEEKKHYRVKYPQVDTAGCCCLKRHKSGGGYITNHWLKVVSLGLCVMLRWSLTNLLLA